MASRQDNKDASDLSEIRRKLIWRMGIAGLMIVGLLGGLALFDYMGASVESEPEAARFTEPVPVPKKTVTQPVTQAEPEPEKKEEKQDAAAPERTAPPVDKSAPKMDAPPKPEIAARPSQGRPSAPVVRTPGYVPAPVSSAGTAPQVKVVEPPLPAPARLFSGFALQAGVFSDPKRAEELHARLTLEGIPSTIESRVQVGPFKSREEAESARAKLKAIGIEAVMLPPARSVRR